MKYDIFISYRRNGGYDTAKHLYDLLCKDGYKASFDVDTLRPIDNDFDLELLKRIDECKVFIIIFNKGALDKCLDPRADKQKDWLRCELSYALEKKKLIIPIWLEGFRNYPDNLPPDIVGIEKKTALYYHREYFDTFYKNVKKNIPFISIQKYRNVFLILITFFILLLLVYNSLDKERIVVDYQPEVGLENILPIDMDHAQDNSKDHIVNPVTTSLLLSDSLVNCEASAYRKEIKLNSNFDLKDCKVSFLSEWIKCSLDQDVLTIEISPNIYAKSRKGVIDVKLNNIIRKVTVIQTNTNLNCDSYCIGSSEDDYSVGVYKGKYGFVKDGKTAVPFIYDYATNFTKSRALGELDGKYGFIDKSGKMVIKSDYMKALEFTENMAAVQNEEGKWGYINSEGNLTIGFEYEAAFSFKDGKAKVKRFDVWYYIDINGKYLND